MKRTGLIILSLIAGIFSVGCSKSPMHEDDGKVEEVKIAVVLTEGSIERWERIMNMAEKNISNATNMRPVFKFYEENSHDMMLLAYDLARDESIISVIGCEGEANTDILAYQMSRLKRKKPMFTFNTSQEVIRKYSTMGFMWGLCESDITQSEVILADIASRAPGSNISLVACNGSYGQTFVDWFAFHAHELGLVPKLIERYDDISEIKECFKRTSEVGGAVLGVPNSAEEALEMIKYSPLFYSYFSHKAFTKKVSDKLGQNTDNFLTSMEGVTLVADPASGFQTIYKTLFDTEPIFGEAQFYDSIMITCLAYALAQERGMTVNEAVAELLRKDCKGQGGWTKESIEEAYRQIVRTKTVPAISGATGKLAFDPDKYTIIQYSTYALQYLYKDHFCTRSYISRNDGKNNSSITGAWEWEKIYRQEIDLEQMDWINNPVKGVTPIIIATSRGWKNYRHQADALEMYNMLKGRGFNNDEIILIMADDLANDPKNPYPGQIYRKPQEKNLYEDITIDYRLEDLQPKDLKDILLGNASDRLPVVAHGDTSWNTMVFWSGHGRPGSLIWDEDETTITGEFLNEVIEEMHKKGKFRKMMFIIEACYAGSVAKECEGTPGVLFMTAANELETSKAELYHSTWGTYMTNSFTSAIVNTLHNDEPRISELYQDAFKMTMGSHVTLYNTKMYGSIYESYTSEFFWDWYNND